MGNPYGYVKFTGDYAKLKTMGYKFQKLYASNYMQWNKGDLRVWRKGADMTHDEFSLYDFITFIRTNPVFRTYKSMYKSMGLVSSFLTTTDSKNNTTFLSYTDENFKLYRGNMDAWKEWADEGKEKGEPEPAYMSSKRLDTELLEQLQELKDLDWYELAEYTPKECGE